jgi:hypothetical protein
MDEIRSEKSLNSLFIALQTSPKEAENCSHFLLYHNGTVGVALDCYSEWPAGHEQRTECFCFSKNTTTFLLEEYMVKPNTYCVYVG